MDTLAPMAERVAELTRNMHGSIRALDIDEAERVYIELTDECGVDPDSDELLPSRVTIGILRGRVRDMLCMLNMLGEDRGIGLKVICLRLMDDPLWESMAEEVEASSPSPEIRASMRTLLDSMPVS